MQEFDKPAYYTVLSSGNLDDVNKELDLVNSSDIKQKWAYEGALQMRKAGLVKIPAEKLHFFKLGYIKLETAILNDRNNVEYRFLRLTIQEHAPHIVKYYRQIESDKEFIIKGFKALPPVIQQVIVDYSKSSKILRPQDLT